MSAIVWIAAVVAFGAACAFVRPVSGLGALRRVMLCGIGLGVLAPLGMLAQNGVALGNAVAENLAMSKPTDVLSESREVAVFGAGCFWCVEPAFEMLDGVLSAESGYMGGAVANPTYEQVCTGKTGHAEVVKVEFDPRVISYAQLVDWFFKLHDPTTLNRQGADVGTQYRSVIFTYGERQQQEALAGKARAGALYADPVVTFVEPAQTYYKAEGYHQDYFKNNPNQPYCRAVIAPKLKKLEQLQR